MWTRTFERRAGCCCAVLLLRLLPSATLYLSKHYIFLETGSICTCSVWWVYVHEVLTNSSRRTAPRHIDKCARLRCANEVVSCISYSYGPARIRTSIRTLAPLLSALPYTAAVTHRLRRCPETCQAREKVRFQRCGAECSTLRSAVRPTINSLVSVKANYGSFAVCQGMKVVVAVSFTFLAVRVAFCAAYLTSTFPGTPNRATVYSGRCGHATPSKHAVSSGG